MDMRSRLGSLSIAKTVLSAGPRVGLNTWYKANVHNSNDTNAKARMGRAIAIVRVSCAPTEIQEPRLRIVFNAVASFPFGTEYAERGSRTKLSALSGASRIS